MSWEIGKYVAYSPLWKQNSSDEYKVALINLPNQIVFGNLMNIFKVMT